jgi:hypothetical protein
MFAALDDVTDLAKASLRDFLGCAGEGVDAAYFFDRRGRDGEELATHAEQNDLLSANGLRFCGSW